MTPSELALPSAGPDPLPWHTALAAILGYARGRRPLRFRSPSHPEGRWVQVPAYGYERFDRLPRSTAPLGEPDILPAEGLHGRLEPAAWTERRDTLEHIDPVADAAAQRAGGRALSCTTAAPNSSPCSSARRAGRCSPTSGRATVAWRRSSTGS